MPLLPLLLLLLPLTGCTTAPPNTGRVESFAPVDTRDTYLGRAVDPLEREHEGKSGFVLLDNGLDALSVRTAMMRRAERTLDLQYYIFKSDEVGKYIFLGLLNAGDRGVRVRILLDDYTMDDDASLMMLDSHPNIEVRLYNPFNRFTPRTVQLISAMGRVDRRMHNKVFAADNRAAVIGGRNIANEYFYANPAIVYKDIDVLTVGPAVRKISKAFDLYWNHDLSYPIRTIVRKRPGAEAYAEFRERLGQFAEDHHESDYAQALRESWFSLTEQAHEVDPIWGTCEIVYDLPSKTLELKKDRDVTLAPKLRPYLDGLKSELILVSPYFVPSKGAVARFRGLVERGVRVRILTNSLASSDVQVVYSGYSKYRKSLLEAGVELYELQPALVVGEYGWLDSDAKPTKASLHAKMFIFDREELFIGSMNLDPRSMYTNTEIGAVFHAPEMARDLAERLDAQVRRRAYTLELVPGAFGSKKLRWTLTLEDGETRTWTSEPETSFFKRLGVYFLSFMPIESHL